jgi:hypothetical protein
MAKEATELDKLKARVDELTALLKARPAKEGINDDRYWRWSRKVEAAL